MRYQGAVFPIFGGFWGGQFSSVAGLVVEHINIVYGQVGHTGIQATPLKYHKKRDTLLDYYLNSYTTTTKPPFLRGQTYSSYQCL